MNDQDFIELEDKHRGIQKEYKAYERLVSSTTGEVIEMNEILIAEVKRLTSKNKTTWEIAEEQEVDITECRNENQRLLKESQLYKDLYTKVKKENKRYQQFIRNGVEFGYIFVPDVKSDPAYELIQKALEDDTK